MFLFVFYVAWKSCAIIVLLLCVIDYCCDYDYFMQNTVQQLIKLKSYLACPCSPQTD